MLDEQGGKFVGGAQSSVTVICLVLLLFLFAARLACIAASARPVYVNPDNRRFMTFMFVTSLEQKDRTFLSLKVTKDRVCLII